MNVVIVGAGIVGLSTAYALRRLHPRATITILEKEAEPALHQTGRNSGVIHSGVYYKPGSAKAVNCRLGRELLLDFCRKYEVEFELCGKVVVATDKAQLETLSELLSRGRENGVSCRILETEELRQREPHVSALKALYVEDAGIVDYRAVCRKLIEITEPHLMTGSEVQEVVRSNGRLIVCSTGGDFSCDRLINCAGLQSDRVSRQTGASPPLKIVPFKGEYYRLKDSAQHFCRSLIYPVPDTKFPFLGVHLTRMIGGGVFAGPNAVLALGREAYGRGDANLSDLLETLSYRGFWRLAARHWRMGVDEMLRSLSKALFVKALQKLCPEIRGHHLISAGSGIRAQAVRPNGQLEDDFQIVGDHQVTHVLNAPSPAATASLAIGQEIARRVHAL